MDTYQYQDEIEAVINSHRTKLWDQSHYHMEFVPIANYLTAQGYTVDSDTKVIIENGLLMVISKRDEGVGRSVQNEVIKNVIKAGKSVWSAVKSVGNWFYSIGSCICEFVSPTIDFCTDAFDYVAESAISAGRTIKGKIVEVVKMATQTVKDAADFVSEKVTNAAEAVGDALTTIADKNGITAASRAVADVAQKVGTAISEVATAVSDYIADTRIFQAGKKAFNTAMNYAKNLY